MGFRLYKLLPEKFKQRVRHFRERRVQKYWINLFAVRLKRFMLMTALFFDSPLTKHTEWSILNLCIMIRNQHVDIPSFIKRKPLFYANEAFFHVYLWKSHFHKKIILSDIRYIFHEYPYFQSQFSDMDLEQTASIILPALRDAYKGLNNVFLDKDGYFVDSLLKIITELKENLRSGLKQPQNESFDYYEVYKRDDNLIVKMTQLFRFFSKQRHCDKYVEAPYYRLIRLLEILLESKNPVVIENVKFYIHQAILFVSQFKRKEKSNKGFQKRFWYTVLFDDPIGHIESEEETFVKKKEILFELIDLLPKKQPYREETYRILDKYIAKEIMPDPMDSKDGSIETVYDYLMNGIVKLRKKHTGLPMNIYVSDGSQYKHICRWEGDHRKRFEVQNGYEDYWTGDSFTITVEDSPQIIVGSRSNLTDVDMERLNEFIELNRDFIIALNTTRLDECEFMGLFVPLK